MIQTQLGSKFKCSGLSGKDNGGPECQDLQSAIGFAEQFEFDTGCLQGLKAKLAAVAALLLEARVVLVVEQAGLTGAVRKKKLENVVSKIGEYSTQFGRPVRPLMLKTLLAMAMNKITGPS